MAEFGKITAKEILIETVAKRKNIDSKVAEELLFENGELEIGNNPFADDSEFSEVLDKVMTEFDADEDGFLSEEELDAEYVSPSAQELNLVYYSPYEDDELNIEEETNRNFSTITKTSLTDESYIETITKDDIYTMTGKSYITPEGKQVEIESIDSAYGFSYRLDVVNEDDEKVTIIEQESIHNQIGEDIYNEEGEYLARIVYTESNGKFEISHLEYLSEDEDAMVRYDVGTLDLFNTREEAEMAARSKVVSLTGFDLTKYAYIKPKTEEPAEENADEPAEAEINDAIEAAQEEALLETLEEVQVENETIQPEVEAEEATLEDGLMDAIDEALDEAEEETAESVLVQEEQPAAVEEQPIVVDVPMPEAEAEEVEQLTEEAVEEQPIVVDEPIQQEVEEETVESVTAQEEQEPEVQQMAGGVLASEEAALESTEEPTEEISAEETLVEVAATETPAEEVQTEEQPIVVDEPMPEAEEVEQLTEEAVEEQPIIVDEPVVAEEEPAVVQEEQEPEVQQMAGGVLAPEEALVQETPTQEVPTEETPAEETPAAIEVQRAQPIIVDEPIPEAEEETVEPVAAQDEQPLDEVQAEEPAQEALAGTEQTNNTTATSAVTIEQTSKTPATYGSYTSGTDFTNDKSAVLSRQEYPQGWQPADKAYEYLDSAGTSYTKMSPNFLQYYATDLNLADQDDDGIIYDKEGNAVGVAYLNSDGSTSFYFLTDKINEINSQRGAKVSDIDGIGTIKNTDTLTAKKTEDILVDKYKYTFGDDGVIYDKNGNAIGKYEYDSNGTLIIKWEVGSKAGKTQESSYDVDENGNITCKRDVLKDSEGNMLSDTVALFDENGKTTESSEISRVSAEKYKRVKVTCDENGKKSTTTNYYATIEDAQNEVNPIQPEKTGSSGGSLPSGKNLPNGLSVKANGSIKSDDGSTYVEMKGIFGADEIAAKIAAEYDCEVGDLKIGGLSVTLNGKTVAMLSETSNGKYKVYVNTSVLTKKEKASSTTSTNNTQAPAKADETEAPEGDEGVTPSKTPATPKTPETPEESIRTIDDTKAKADAVKIHDKINAEGYTQDQDTGIRELIYGPKDSRYSPADIKAIFVAYKEQYGVSLVEDLYDETTYVFNGEASVKVPFLLGEMRAATCYFANTEATHINEDDMVEVKVNGKSVKLYQEKDNTRDEYNMKYLYAKQDGVSYKYEGSDSVKALLDDFGKNFGQDVMLAEDGYTIINYSGTKLGVIEFSTDDSGNTYMTYYKRVLTDNQIEERTKKLKETIRDDGYSREQNEKIKDLLLYCTPEETVRIIQKYDELYSVDDDNGRHNENLFDALYYEDDVDGQFLSGQNGYATDYVPYLLQDITRRLVYTANNFPSLEEDVCQLIIQAVEYCGDEDGCQNGILQIVFPKNGKYVLKDGALTTIVNGIKDKIKDKDEKTRIKKYVSLS